MRIPLAILVLSTVCTAFAQSTCELIDDPDGFRYLECDPAKIKEAKEAAAARPAAVNAKPGHEQSVEEFKANMAVENAKTDAERAAAVAKAEAVRVAEEKRVAAAKAREDAAFKSSGTVGAWNARYIENKMDNKTRLMLVLQGSEPFPNRIRQRPPEIVVRCEAGKIDVLVNAATHISSPNDDLYQHRFRARFDDGKPEQIVGDKATSSDAVFFPNPSHYLKKLRAARKLMVEVTPYGFAPATSTFNVAGLDQHREAMVKHCKI